MRCEFPAITDKETCSIYSPFLSLDLQIYYQLIYVVVSLRDVSDSFFPPTVVKSVQVPTKRRVEVIYRSLLQPSPNPASSGRQDIRGVKSRTCIFISSEIVVAGMQMLTKRRLFYFVFFQTTKHEVWITQD